MTGRQQRGWIVASAALGVVCALLVGVLIARPSQTAPTGARPTLRISAVSNPGEVGVDLAAFLPTITVYYADGSHGEGSAALAAPWQPDRAVRMVTVAAGVECSIEVDDALVDLEHAAVNRVAVCVWTAPS